MVIEDNRGFRIPYRWNVNSGIWIPWAESRIPKRRTWDSASKNFPDCRTQTILSGAREKGRKRESLNNFSTNDHGDYAEFSAMSLRSAAEKTFKF